MSENTENSKGKPLFIAPIAMKEGDEITLLFGQPVIIRRDGVEIWRTEDIPPDLLDAMLSGQCF